VTVVGDRFSSRKGGGVRIAPNTGGPGTSEPGRIHHPLISLRGLLNRAYGSYFEIVGPGWIETETYSVDATMPSNATAEQFQEMLRNLITSRFQLKYHVDAKQFAGYSLVVAKGGVKFKESVIPVGEPCLRWAGRRVSRWGGATGRA